MKHWFAASLALAAAPLTAHEIADDGPGKPQKWSVDRLGFMPADQARLAMPSRDKNAPMAFSYVIDLPRRWAQTQTVRICFVGGSSQTRDRVLVAAMLWQPHINLTLDGGGPGGRSCAATGELSEIRIGFNEPGHWSYVGIDSVHPYLMERNMTSMNLAGLESAPASVRFTGVVLHEFGHALGFNHEHQSPAGGCDTAYDWPKLYAWYKSMYDWEIPMVDRNVRQLIADRTAYDWSEVDRASIMLYASDARFIVPGGDRCMFQANNTLSDYDKRGATKAYPRTDALAVLKLQVASLPIALEATLPAGLKDALRRQALLANAQLLKRTGN